MIEHKFEIKFGKSWRKYARALRETAPAVIETFKGTSLEENMQDFYEDALPKKRESPIKFLLRNQSLAYTPTSRRQKIDFDIDGILAKIGWYAGKIPLLKRIIKLNGVSTELYIGQETEGYVARENMKKEKGFGKDHFHIRVDNFGKALDVDFDVGFGTDENQRNYFLKINVYDNSLLPAAQSAHNIIKKHINKK